MSDGRGLCRNTTHDWSRGLDLGHLAEIQRTPARFAPGGALHLVLEVLAYCADEARAVGSVRVVVTLMPGGSVSVADDGRGTDTRVDHLGRAFKKPIMATKDLRFFDVPASVTLPDGYLRRGMSVVAALSEWLVHTNRRSNGSWTQRYERGIPVTDLIAEVDDGTTGTTVAFRPDPALLRAGFPSADQGGGGFVGVDTPRQLREVQRPQPPALAVGLLHRADLDLAPLRRGRLRG